MSTCSSFARSTLLVLRTKSTTRNFLTYFQSRIHKLRYERVVAAHEDLKEVEIQKEGEGRLKVSIKDFYNNNFLLVARKFIISDNTEAEEALPGRKDQGDHQETLTDRLMSKLHLNSSLKETVPHHVSEKSRPQKLSTFTYSQFSPGNRDYLISSSPDPRSNRYMVSSAQ